VSKLRVLDLFSGIGGFSLGLERTGGFETVAFCEIDPFCRRVLAKHWPEVPCYDDVRTLTADALARDGIEIDVICGGFPCQDISEAGQGAGLEGERSGLWKQYARLIGELRPNYVIVENVSALLFRGMGTVLGDLAEIGFDACWESIPASAVGAHHQRERIWIVAYPGEAERRKNAASRGRVARPKRVPRGQEGADRLGAGRQALAHTTGARSLPRAQAGIHRSEESSGAWDEQSERCGWWATEPAVGRMAHGVPDRVDRISALGNAVVPQIPELIGRAILQARAA
jgi:DNA (cytosine-5)-methyltransferase 1